MAMFSNWILLCLAVLSVGQSFILDGPEDGPSSLENGLEPQETDYDEPIEKMEDHDYDIDDHPDFLMARSASDSRASKQPEQNLAENVRSPRLSISQPGIHRPSHNSPSYDLHRPAYTTKYNPYDDYQSSGYSSYPSYGYRESIGYREDNYPNSYSGGYNGGYQRHSLSRGYGHSRSYGRNSHGNSYGGGYGRQHCGGYGRQHGGRYGGQHGRYSRSYGGYGSYGDHRRGGYCKPVYSRSGHSRYGSNRRGYSNSYGY